MNIVLGNIIALLASLVMIYTGLIKDKSKIIYVQSIQIFLFAISNAILGGITGVITNIVSFARNILCFKNKLNLPIKILITILSIIFSIIFNNIGFIGILPLISTISYIWLMDIKDVIKFKFLIIFTLVLWCIYDFAIKSYTGGLFNLFTIITNIISIFQIYIIQERK